MSFTENQPDQTTEVEHLRARVAQLEAEMLELEAWANRAVAAAQDRVYWLDRWHLDLNALMARRGAAEFRALVRALRAVLRSAIKVKRRLRGMM